LPAIILAVGLIALYVGYSRMSERSLLEKEGMMTSGVVEWAGGGARSYYSIRVRYRDGSGREWTRYFAVFSSQYRAGQSVEVVYLRTNPEVVMLGSHEAGETHGQEVVASVLGGIAVVVGGLMAFVMYRAT
jgi:hypothetical protein